MESVLVQGENLDVDGDQEEDALNEETFGGAEQGWFWLTQSDSNIRKGLAIEKHPGAL